MKYLTANEIVFMKDTGWSWTVEQCNEYARIGKNRATNFEPIKDFEAAQDIAKNKYNVDLITLNNKTNAEDSDAISLEYAAAYLLYTFFSTEELIATPAKDLLKWLQNMKYFFGWRKADEQDAAIACHDALNLKSGVLVLINNKDDDVFFTESVEYM